MFRKKLLGSARQLCVTQPALGLSHFQDLQDKLLFLSKSIWMLLFESSIQAIIHLRVSKFLALITSCSNEFLSLILHHMKTALLLISPNFATFPIIFCSLFV